MAKDPAFLFYYQDFLVGTEFMTDDEVGKYIRILCHLADKNELSEKQVLRICKASAIPSAIQEKLTKDENGMYFNQRLRIEKEKRVKFTESRRKNALTRKASAKHMLQHMENENENENINEDANKVKEIKERWNEFAQKHQNIPNVSKLSDKRIRAIRNRLKEEDFDIEEIFKKIEQSDFLLGLKTDWKVDFDFVFCSANNYLKILEGKYSNGQRGKISHAGIKEWLEEKENERF